jgi:hypothetical protein
MVGDYGDVLCTSIFCKIEITSEVTLYTILVLFMK